jgi:hypothetical protein
MPAPPDPVLLYHMTHLDNLPGILQSGCLHCQQQLSRSGLHPVSIAYPGIQDRRLGTTVPCGPGGVLHDYVPFYFAPRSPMLYAIHKNRVEAYDGGQTPILHLVSSVPQIQTTGHQFVFTDGHATMAFSRFFTEPDELDQLDWPLMKATYWRDTPQDPDRKRRRQAEFLVYNKVNVSAFIGIGVINKQIQQRVEKLLQTHHIELPVRIRRNWYY